MDRRTSTRANGPAAEDASALPSWVTRERLLARLASAASSPAVVISGAAGAGKSTLATQWAAADPRPHVTIALDALLDDPAALGHRLVDALEGLGSPAPQTRAVVTGAEPAFSAVLLPALHELARSRNRSFVLVLDDVHLVRNPACHDMLRAVSDGIPAGSTLALLTRSAAPTWLGRARSEGRLVEVRDLAFDRDEAARLFADMAAPVDEPTLAEVLDHSEGWAVGLYLSALARRDGNGANPDGDFPRFVGDYIQTQILDRLDPVAVSFLLQSSILEEVTGPLCVAVTGRPEADAILDDLHRRIQLVIEIATDPPRYRYHHLFAECLQAKLRVVEPESTPRLHEAAARWCAEQGDLDRAIRHAKSSGNLELTGQLVWSDIVACIGSGRPDRLHSWLLGLSDRQLQHERWLSLAAGWLALQEGDGARMQRWALVAERHAGRDWRARVATDEYAASLATILVLIGQPLLDVVALSTGALDGLPPDSAFRPPTLWLRGVAQTLVGHLEDGRESLTQSAALAEALDVPVISADARAFLGVLAILGGEREPGLRQINEAVGILEHFDLDRLATSAHTVTAQAFALAVVGDRPAAVAALAKARRLSGLVTAIAPWFAVTGRLIQARTAMLLDDGATARVLINEAGQQMTPDLAGTLVESMLDDTRATLRRMATGGNAGVALTTAELRVLQFLPSHLSFPQIGERLFLSQNTIKTHALSIYRKFAVSSRSEAVARAQQLGLVEPPALD